MRTKIKLWQSGGGPKFLEAVELLGYMQSIVVTSNMTPRDVGNEVLRVFRSVHGPQFLSTPFVWAKLGQGHTKFDERMTWPGFTTPIEDLKDKFRNSYYICIFEEGWDLPENDNLEWRLQVAGEMGEDHDPWEKTTEEDEDDVDGLRGCEGCSRRYPPEMLAAHQGKCQAWLDQQRRQLLEGSESDSDLESLKNLLPVRGRPKKTSGGQKKTKRVLPTSKKRPGKAVAPLSKSTIVKDEPTEELKVPNPVQGEVIELIDNTDDEDVKPRIASVDQPPLSTQQLLAQLAQQPGFGEEWLQRQTQHMALADAGTSAVDGLGLTGVQEEPLFYSEDEDGEERGVQEGFGDEDHEQWINDPFDQDPNALAAELYSHLETHMDWSGGMPESTVEDVGGPSAATVEESGPREVEATVQGVEEVSTSVPVKRGRGRPRKTDNEKGKGKEVVAPVAPVPSPADDSDAPERPNKRRRIQTQRLDLDNYAKAGRK